MIELSVTNVHENAKIASMFIVVSPFLGSLSLFLFHIDKRLYRILDLAVFLALICDVNMLLNHGHACHTEYKSRKWLHGVVLLSSRLTVADLLPMLCDHIKRHILGYV